MATGSDLNIPIKLPDVTAIIAESEGLLQDVTRRLDPLEKDAKEIRGLLEKAVDELLGLQVTDAESYVRAGEALKKLKGLIMGLKDKVSPAKSAAYKTHRMISSIEADFSGPIARLENAIKVRMCGFLALRDRQVRAEAAQVEAEKVNVLEEDKLAEAIALAEAGDQEGAERMLEEGGFFLPPAIPETVPKIKGISVKTNWTYRVMDEAKIPRKFLKVDSSAIGKVVKALKERHGIKGIEAFQEPSLAVTGSK